MKNKNKTILIIRISALGDVAMTIPAIYSLALNNPEIHIKVLTRPFFSKIFINRPKNISFILLQEKHKGLTGITRLIRELHKEDISYVADFHNILLSWIIDISFILRGIKVAIVNKKRFERLLIINNKNIKSSSFIQRYAETLFKLDLNVLPIIDRILTNGNNPKPQCLYYKNNEKWIGIAPMARYKNKIYPLDYMKKVIHELSCIKEFKIFLFGSKEDILLLTSLKSNKTICIAGTMTIEEELSLMSQLDIMISMDSANMHLASLVGTKVISIWGSTTPACGFLGWQQSSDNAIYSNLKCQPCSIAGNDNCRFKDYRCLNINPLIITNLITRLLSKT